MSSVDDFVFPASEPLEAADVDDFVFPRDDFGRTLAGVMSDSLFGNPGTVFYEDSGSKGFVYRRYGSSNADWFQDATKEKKAGGLGLDGKKLRQALERQRSGKPLNLRRAEDRWLSDVTARARLEGWTATYDGRESPLSVAPDSPASSREELEKAHVPTPRRRVYLVLPEDVAQRLRARASALNMTPNRYLNEAVPDEMDRRALEKPIPDDGVPF